MQNLAFTLHVHAEKRRERGSYQSFLSSLLPNLYSVTQCFSLTLMFWTDLSNRIFFLLSLLHSSLSGIPLVHFEFFLFFSLLLSTFVFSTPCCNSSPCVLSHSIILSRIAHIWFIWFAICYVLPMLRPPPAPSLLFLAHHHHLLPLRLWPRCQTCLALHSLAGHRPDAQPRAGRRGPVLYGLTGSP